MKGIHFILEINGRCIDDLIVTQFEGVERFNQCFSFSIQCQLPIKQSEQLKLAAQACFQIHYEGEPSRFVHGEIVEVEERAFIGDCQIVNVELKPLLNRLSRYDTNEIYIDLSVPAMIQQLLEEAEIPANLVEFRFSDPGLYEKDGCRWPFRMQYKETHLNFLLRIIEREGIYFFFEHNESASKLVFCDGNSGLKKQSVHYTSPGSLAATNQSVVIHSLVSKQQVLPKKLVMRDFNDEKPSLDIRAETLIDLKGQGEINYYGMNIRNEDEVKRLADIHAQAFTCCQTEYYAESNLPGAFPGARFTVENHPKESFNCDYQLSEVRHQGFSQAYFQQHENTEHPVYSNSWVALPDHKRFVANRTAEVSHIQGTIEGLIDGESDQDDYAQLDDMGRYKVHFPFDRRDRSGGKASHWVRMAQPFGGVNEGMHFPLKKGTRILLNFIGGDPDRPVISSTVGDSGEQTSIVNENNRSNKVLKTAQGNKIEIEDKTGSNRIKLESPTNNTYMHLGAPNHDGSGYVMVTQGIERIDVGGGQRLTVETSKSGSKHTVSTSAAAADKSSLFQFKKLDNDGRGTANMTTDEEIGGEYLIERRKGAKYLWTDGNTYTYGGSKDFAFGNSYSEAHADPSGSKNIGTNTFTIPTVTGGPACNPDANFVEKVWADTFNYQSGNNFNWGDTADYNFGNGYEENHMNGNAVHVKGKNDRDSSPGPSGGSISTESVTGFGDKGSLWITKSFGNSYDYRDGNALEVVDGGSETHVYGDAHDEIHGNSVEHVRGSSHSTHHGAVNEMFMGAVNSMALSVSNETVLGVKNDIFVGASNEMALAAKMDIFIGMVTEIKAAFSMEISMGGKIEVDTTVDLKTHNQEIQALVNKIETSANSIQNNLNTIGNKASSIGTAAIKITSGGLNMIS